MEARDFAIENARLLEREHRKSGREEVELWTEAAKSNCNVPYLIDTCVLSEFTKPKPEPLVDAWLESIPDGSDFVSVLTLGELENASKGASW